MDRKIKMAEATRRWRKNNRERANELARGYYRKNSEFNYETVDSLDGFVQTEFDGLYINKDGVVVCASRWTNLRVLKKSKTKAGYHVVGHNGTKYVHRLLCNTFLYKGCEKLVVNHKNGIKTDNRLENLEWVTRGENNTHARRVLGVGSNKLSSADVIKIIKMIKDGSKIKEIANIFSVTPENISSIKNKKTWVHISRE